MKRADNIYDQARVIIARRFAFKFNLFPEAVTMQGHVGRSADQQTQLNRGNMYGLPTDFAIPGSGNAPI